MLKTRTVPIVVVLCLAAVAHGQTVTGTVTNTFGVGVVGATVAFNGGTSSAVTTASGVFAATVTPGIYEVTVNPGTSTLAPARFEGIVVGGGGLNMGAIVLQPGVALSGTVLMLGGLPVVSGDINVYVATTGFKLYTPGDNTNASGVFSVTVPVGTYEVRISPPQGALLVAQQIPGIVVNGPTNMGVITLPNGVLLSGTVVHATTNQPLANVDLDVDVQATGQRVVTPNDATNASGVFSVVVPFGVYRVSFDPPLGMANVARRIDNVAVNGTTNMGLVPLQPGFIVNGSVVGPAGPVAGADLDVRYTLGGGLVHVANDTTGANGSFQFVVPGGTYFATVAPPTATALVGGTTGNFSVAGNINLPGVGLQNGVLLSGTLRGFNGVPLAGADLDVIHPTSGATLVTPLDNTDATGHFSIRVPNGTWNVRIDPPKASLSADEVVTNVVVNGNTVLNRTLSLIPMVAYLDGAGATVVPQNGPVLIHTGLYNPWPFTRTLTLNLILRDPAFGEHAIIPAFPLTLPAQGFSLFLSFPLGLPSINPAHFGFDSFVEVRLSDPMTNAVVSSDGFTVVIQ